MSVKRDGEGEKQKSAWEWCEVALCFVWIKEWKWESGFEMI